MTLTNKGSATVSLVGWTLHDRSGATWHLSGSIAPGQSRTFLRSGQAMSLNNGGDEVTLLDVSGMEREWFAYTASMEGSAIVTGH